MDRLVIARRIELRLERLHHLDRQSIGRRVLERQPKDRALPFCNDWTVPRPKLRFRAVFFFRTGPRPAPGIRLR
jgi:hypothetical protein